jgi:hypothetical protein
VTSIPEWADLLSGAYGGWMRPPDGEWEDIIGSVKVHCTANEDGTLTVTITTFEFGKWTGCLRLDRKLLQGSTGHDDDYFRCTLDEQRAGDSTRYRFRGGIYERPAKLLFELVLEKDRTQPGGAG